MKFVPALTLALGLAAAPAFADCSLNEMPTVPDGKASTMEQMLAAKKEVDAYMAASNEYLECLAGEAASKAEGLAEDAAAEVTSTMSEMHNAAVAEQEKLAAAFNQAIRDYKAANPQ